MFASGTSPSPYRNWDAWYNMWSGEFHHLSVWYTCLIDSQKKVTNEIESAIKISAHHIIIFWWPTTTFLSTYNFFIMHHSLKTYADSPEELSQEHEWLNKTQHKVHYFPLDKDDYLPFDSKT